MILDSWNIQAKSTKTIPIILAASPQCQLNKTEHVSVDFLDTVCLSDAKSTVFVDFYMLFLFGALILC